VADLDAALADDRLAEPVLTVAADLPLLAAEALDRVLAAHEAGPLTVAVPVVLFDAEGGRGRLNHHAPRALRWINPCFHELCPRRGNIGPIIHERKHDLDIVIPHVEQAAEGIEFELKQAGLIETPADTPVPEHWIVLDRLIVTAFELSELVSWCVECPHSNRPWIEFISDRPDPIHEFVNISALVM
jgi:hypothetical protein